MGYHSYGAFADRDGGNTIVSVQPEARLLQMIGVLLVKGAFFMSNKGICCVRGKQVEQLADQMLFWLFSLRVRFMPLTAGL